MSTVDTLSSWFATSAAARGGIPEEKSSCIWEGSVSRGRVYCVGKRPYVDLVIISVKRDHKLVLVFVLVLKWTSNVRNSTQNCKIPEKNVAKFNPKLFQGPEDELAGRRAPSALWPLRNCDPVMATGKKRPLSICVAVTTDATWSGFMLLPQTSWRCLKILDRFWWYIWWYLTMSNISPMPNIRMFGSGHPVTHIHKILRGFHKWHHKP